MESVDHHRLKQVALRWLQNTGCVAFCCELSWGWVGIVDAAGIKASGDVYIVEAKISNSDLKADYKRRKAYKIRASRRIDFVYYILADGVDRTLLQDPSIGILNQYGRVLRNAKRRQRQKTLEVKCADFERFARSLSWRAYKHVIREEKEQLEFCI